MIIDNMLYIGSFRYMYDYDWNYFSAILHTTKEIIYFLLNINNINNIINKNPPELTNFIFRDIYHQCVINDSTNFINKYINKDINKNINKINNGNKFKKNNVL